MTKANTIRLTVFCVVCVLILTVCAWKIIRTELALHYGTAYTFRISGYDPYDLARGRYLAFSMPNTALSAEEDLKQGNFCVSVRNGADGLAEFVRLSANPPDEGDWLAVSKGYYWHPNNEFDAPFSRYYVNERSAPEAERFLQDAQRDGTAALRIRVHHGFAAIEDLLVDGVPLREKCRP